MSTAKRNWSIGFYDGFYWIGAAMTMVCFALTLAGNTELLCPLEHSHFPLSWAFAGAAILAFLAAEFCHFAFSRPSKAEEAREEEYKSSQLSMKWEAVEPQS